ncbi:unnamed protein product [Rotaria sp. Silwood2]|nr:unnamed protein product [Rotaria sp. Silwood2]
MSATNKSHFEALPIEIIHRIFNYLDVETILFSIRCMSKQFYYAANIYDRYELNFLYMFKSDLPVIARIINPKNIISITLSDELQTNNQIELFFSHFRIDQFIQLRSLKLTKVQASDLNKFKNHTMQCLLRTFSISLDRLHLNTHMSLMSSILSNHNLQKFEFKGFSDSISELQWPNQCSLKHVIIYECHWKTLYTIISHLPYLQTLIINKLRKYSSDNCVAMNDLTSNLTSLLLNNCTGIKMNDVETLLSQLPVLKHLRLLFPRCEPNSGLFDGYRWEKFIRTKLSLLNNFEFSFDVLKRFNSNDVTTESLIASFRTQFWLKDKNWFIKCNLQEEIVGEVFHLYSIPLFKKYVTYPEYQNAIQHSTSNIADNNATIIVNTSELSLDLDKMIFNESQQNVSIILVI